MDFNVQSTKQGHPRTDISIINQYTPETILTYKPCLFKPGEEKKEKKTKKNTTLEQLHNYLSNMNTNTIPTPRFESEGKSPSSGINTPVIQ